MDHLTFAAISAQIETKRGDGRFPCEVRIHSHDVKRIVSELSLHLTPEVEISRMYRPGFLGDSNDHAVHWFADDSLTIGTVELKPCAIELRAKSQEPRAKS